ncbi:MAG: PEP-utilizing enzyme [Actinomycetota bacterium]|nr:PEP-utilizing enzyme [Actinomycetota bacterium]
MADHFPRACTAEYRRLLATAMEAGEAEHFAAYGMPARTLRPVFVHGHVYLGAVPLVGRATNALPPRAVLQVVARLHPAFRKRERAARRALAEGLAVTEAERWRKVDRASWQARNAACEAIDPGAFDDDDDAALAAHLADVRTLCDDGYREHFRLHGCDLLPTALLLVFAADRGISAGEVLAQLVGCSPASVAGEPPPPWRLVTGYDLDSLAVAELPPMAPGPVRDAVSAPDDEVLLDRFAPDDRPEAARLLADARATYGVRDDNGLLTAAWPVGLLRRAMLEAGRRVFSAADLGIEATVDELVARLGGASAPSATTIAARAAQRRVDSSRVPPPLLGPDLGLPFAALPRGMATVARALITLRDLGISEPGRRRPLEGDGIGTGRATGRAVVADDASEALARIEPGDVLVARGTAPAWNAVLAMVSAVVVEEGGPLGHAAIVARELGIPAVVGASGAVALIPDGSTIEVDAATGRVCILVRAPET